MYTMGGSSMPKLKRTQMYFPEDVLNELKTRAEREKTSISYIVRKAVLELVRKDEKRNWENDPLWDMVGASKSREGDLAANHDNYLYREAK
jgi:hypothetical protein